MKKIRYVLILLIFFCVTNKTFADNAKIFGNVIDSVSNQTLEFVTVQVLSYTDTTYLNGTITDINGYFEVKNLEYGNYYVKLNYLGYNTFVIENLQLTKSNSVINCKTIKMQANENLLNEIVVTKEKQVLELDINKQIINFTKDELKTATDITDILINSPSITKSGADEILLRGSSSYKVLLDGKPTNDNAILFSIPINSIDKVEIITSPDAKYDAEGKSGIINIVTKKQYFDGYSASVSGYVFSNEKYKLGGSVYYKKKRFNLFVSCTGKSLKSKNIKNKTLNMLNVDYSLFNQTIDKRLNKELVTNIKTGYKFNENNILSFSTSLNKNIVYYNYNANINEKFENNYMQYSTSNENIIWEQLNYNFLVDFTHIFKNGATLNTYIYSENLDYLLVDTLKSYNTRNNYADIISNLSAMSNYHNKKTDYYVYNADYSINLKDIYTLETGVRFSNIDYKGNFNLQNYDTITNFWRENMYFKNKPIYYRNIVAGYINLSGEIIGITYMAGIRGEYSDRLLKYSDRSDKFSNSKFNIFPSFSLNKNIGIHALQLSFSQRVIRPSYDVLNIAPMFYDVNDIYIGAPNLKSEYSKSIDLGYSFFTQKISFFSQLYFSLSKDFFLDYNKIGQNTVRSVKNGYKYNDYGLDLGITYMPTEWCNIDFNSNLMLGNQIDSINNRYISENMFMASTNLSINFMLKTKTYISLSTMYSPKTIQMFYQMEQSYFLSCAIGQDFWKEKANISINIDNVFRDNYAYTISDAENYIYFKYKTQYPVFTINFLLKLNNYKSRYLKAVYEEDYYGGGLK